MKACPLCGIDADDAEKKCGGCGYPFSGAEVDADDEDIWLSSESSAAPDRPDGGTPMIVGWVCLAASLIFTIVAFNQGPESWQVSAAEYGSSSALSGLADAYGRQWAFQLAAGGFFTLFLVFWSVGYVVRAISFLPGKVDSGRSNAPQK